MSSSPSSRIIWTRSNVRWGLGAAFGVALFGVLCSWQVRPLHAEGVWQPLTGFLNGLDDLLQLPASSLARFLRLDRDLAPEVVGGPVRGILTPLCYFLVFVLLRALWQWAGRPQAQANGTSSISRRRFLRTGMAIAGGGAAAGLGYALLVEPRWYTVTQQRWRIRGLPAGLNGLRAVQLTDIHHGPWLSLSYVRQVIDAANELNADLFLTGDYVHHSADYLRPVVSELKRLKPNIGTVGVLGNHDWSDAGGERSRRVFADAGLPLIDNGRLILTPERKLVEKADLGLALCGVGDLAWGNPDYRAALGGLPESMPRLLLSHQPHVAEELGVLEPRLRVDLMLSGHTHGGRICLPFLGPLFGGSAPSGTKYVRGRVEGPVSPVYTCRGIGLSMFPIRIGASPEITIHELEADPA